MFPTLCLGLSRNVDKRLEPPAELALALIIVSNLIYTCFFHDWAAGNGRTVEITFVLLVVLSVVALFVVSLWFGAHFGSRGPLSPTERFVYTRFLPGLVRFNRTVLGRLSPGSLDAKSDDDLLNAGARARVAARSSAYHLDPLWSLLAYLDARGLGVTCVARDPKALDLVVALTIAVDSAPQNQFPFPRRSVGS